MTQTTILIRRDGVVGRAPASGTLAIGELALNTADGQLYYYNSISGSATASLVRPMSRSVIELITGQINSGSSEVGSFSLGKTFILLRVSSSKGARVRLYETANDRDNDASRQPGTDPLLFQEHGIILDLLITGSFLDWRLAPVVMGQNGDAPESGTIYYSITNELDSPSASFDVKFTKIEMQDPTPTSVA